MGVPQGGPISPTISNIVLNGIENCVDLSHIIPEQPPWPARRFQFNYDGKPFVCILNCANMNAVHAELEQLEPSGRYLYTYLYRGKKFAVGKKTDDTALYQFMWQKYLIKVGKSRYWGIQLTPRTTRHNDQSFQLLDFGTVPVATPKIIEGLSAYHPDDQPKLLRKAVEWQWGIRGQLLHKSKGLCQCCGTILIDQKSELHHYVPLVLGGSNHPNNLRVLCIHCHKDIPRKFTDPPSEKVLYYIDIGLLSPAVLPRPRNV
eukprot:gene8006-1235_t